MLTVFAICRLPFTILCAVTLSFTGVLWFLFCCLPVNLSIQFQMILLFPWTCCRISRKTSKKSALAFLNCLVAVFLRVLKSNWLVSYPDFKDCLRAPSLSFSSCPSSAVNHGRTCFRLCLNIFVLVNLHSRFESIVWSSFLLTPYVSSHIVPVWCFSVQIPGSQDLSLLWMRLLCPDF